MNVCTSSCSSVLGFFGWDDAAAATESFSLSGWVMEKWQAVKDWFTGIFSWGKKAGETEDGFSISKLVSEAVDAISKWFRELLDSITNFDFANFARGIMPDFLADMIFGKGESEVEKPAEAKKAEAAAQGGEAEKALEKPDTEGMFAAILNPFRTYVKDLLAEGGTNMMPPVYEAILEKTDFPMKHQIVLVTDGDIGFEEEMMAIVHEHIGKKRLHVVGIGSAPNSFLVKNLAKIGRGSHLYSGGGRHTSEGYKYSGKEFD